MESSTGYRSKRLRHGFSLVEVLVVIVVIGIISAISIATISSIVGNSEETTARRQAQLLAAMAGQALHAGDMTLTSAATKEEAVALLSAGVTGAGAFENVPFRLQLSAEEQQEVLPFLVLSDGLLVFNDVAP